MRGSLGNNASSVSADRRARRKSRYNLRKVSQSITDNKRHEKCGRVPVSGDVQIRLNTDGIAGFRGLHTCGSVWVCPVCSSKIGYRRAREVQALVNRAVDEGLAMTFVTLTIQHHKGQRLSDLWDVVASSWRKVCAGRAWQHMKAKAGFRGFVRCLEVTHGRAGWHVHIHVLMLTDAHPPQTLRNVGEWVAGRWRSAVGASGYYCSAEHGTDVRIVEGQQSDALSDYISKFAHEVSDTGIKAGRCGNRTPWGILSALDRNPTADDHELWAEYARVSKGRRQLTWSKGLKDWAGVDELDDEQAAAEEVEGEEVVITIANEAWSALWPYFDQAALLDCAELGGYWACYDYLQHARQRYLTAIQ